MKIIESLIKPMINMEVIALHYYPQSRRHSNSMTTTVHVDNLGDIEFKDMCLSKDTINAIRSDILLEMKKKLGL